MKISVRILLPFVLLISAYTASFSQVQNQGNPKVMIIPFDPDMYFSDADDLLAKYNQKSIKEVRTLFRYGLNVNLNAKILSNYGTRALLTDTAKTATEDLYNIYKSISYFKDKSIRTPDNTNSTGVTTSQQSEQKKPLINFKKKEDESTAQVNSKVKQTITPNEYMNVKIHNKEMLTYLRNRYGTDLFVFVNQFNLATNYEHCLDRATNTFERDLKVHFSIFDYTGKQLAGDVVIVHFPSNTNDMTEIMRNNFPVISDYLTGNLPKNVKHEKEVSTKSLEEEIMEFDKDSN